MALFHDLRYALRMLRKDAAFTLVAVLSLALGTGANSTMFTMVNGILLRPLPVSRPHEVLTIAPRNPANTFEGLSFPAYVDYRDRMQTMTGLVASALYRFAFSPSPDVLPHVKYGLLVSGNLFDAMGVKPILGRSFRPDEDEVPGRDAVVILGHDFWRDEFGADPQVIGRTIRLNGLDFTVIGVAPETFTGMDEFFKATMFIPVMMIPRLAADPAGNLLENRERRDFTVKGRLKNNVTMAQAEAELLGIASGLEEKYPATDKGRGIALRSETAMHMQRMPRESSFMVMAMIMGSLVLLISCFNIANLLMSRARARELAVRLAMGANRRQVVRQLLTESLVLGAAGMAAGVWFAWGAAQLFNRIKVPSDLPFMIDMRADYRVVMFSLAAGLASVLLFGLAPALQSSRVDLVGALKAADDSCGSGGRRHWFRNVLVVSQIALSVVILMLATMVYRGFSTELSTTAGLRTDHLLMLSFDPRIIRYNDAQTAEFYRRLIEQARLTPGVKSVSLAATMPFAINQRAFLIAVSRDGEQPLAESDKDRILHNIVDENFFETMGVPILRGRGFEASDREDAPRVVVVNEVLAERYWPGRDPVGRRIQIETDTGFAWAEVVGVARTSKYVWMTEAPADYLYLPIAQHFRRQRMLFVESVGNAASLASAMREVVRTLDPNMPVYDVRTIEEYFDAWVLATASTILYMIGSMGLTGLALAMIGLYGLVAYSVSLRTREFGIRMAIGAAKENILMMVLRQGSLLCAAGTLTGIALALPASRVMQSFVFGAGADIVPYLVVPALLMLLTLLASYGPARRASSIDPMKALRNE